MKAVVLAETRRIEVRDLPGAEIKAPTDVADAGHFKRDLRD